MKALIFLAVLLTAGYLAGIRHSDWLTVTFAAGAFFWLLCAAQAVILSRRVKPAERERSESWLIGSVHEVPMSVHSRTFLPCSRFVARLAAAYSWETKAEPDVSAEAEEKPGLKGRLERLRERLSLRRARRKARRAKEKKYQKAEGTVPPYGSDLFSLSATVPHCGVATFTTDSLRVYDSCGMFSVRRRFRTPSVIAAVYPPIVPAALPAGLFAGDAGSLRGLSEGPGKGEEDFRDIRSYREGDPLRRIHWKRSAGREEWLLREYEGGEERGYRLVLDTTHLSEKDASGRDRFYAFAAAAAAGFIEKGVKAEMVFASADDKEEATDLRDEEDIRTVLYRLYVRGFADPVPEAYLEEPGVLVMDGEGVLRLHGQELCRIPEPVFGDE